MASPDEPADWWVYTGTGRFDRRRKTRFPDPPPWRHFTGVPAVAGEELPPPPAEEADGARRLGSHAVAVSYRHRREELDLVNAAIYLRRPLLVTGRAGTGKSTLARSIAAELGLGRVLHWPITSRSTLADGLYQYDAIGRLQEVSLLRAESQRQDERVEGQVPDIGRFIRLGPLGSALLPRSRPRVLLVDEIDKSDVDLPNDLLTVFEDGAFAIPELSRLPSTQDIVRVMDADGDDPVPVRRGHVQCAQFPIVVLTSNGERDFPPAFLRRCIRVTLGQPDRDRLAGIVAAHLGPAGVKAGEPVIAEFLRRQEESQDLAADQLLNALYLSTAGAREPGTDFGQVLDALLRPLNISDR